jgi:hypothetical protein
MRDHPSAPVRTWRLSAAASLALYVSACCGGAGQPPCNNPTITVSAVPQGFNISGSQFSGASPCARISMNGLPTTTGASGSIVLGDVACPGGAFSNFQWHYTFFNCTPNTTRAVNIIATDQSTLRAAVKSAAIPWGPTCGLVNYTACGGEGQIPCPGGTCSAGPPDLHPDIQGGMVVCTANCGHTQGYSPCTPGMDGCPPGGGTLVAPQRPCRTTAPGGLNQFTCFDHSRISNTTDCLCVPNSLNTCQVNTSPGNGVCTSGSFSGC